MISSRKEALKAILRGRQKGDRFEWHSFKYLRCKLPTVQVLLPFPLKLAPFGADLFFQPPRDVVRDYQPGHAIQSSAVDELCCFKT